MWLRPTGPRLAALHPAALFQPPVIVLNCPGPLGQAQPRQPVHCQVVGRPVLSVPVSGDDPEDPDQPVTFQMDHRAAGLDRRLTHGLIPPLSHPKGAGRLANGRVLRHR